MTDDTAPDFDTMSDEDLRAFIKERDGRFPHSRTGRDKLVAAARGDAGVSEEIEAPDADAAPDLAEAVKDLEDVDHTDDATVVSAAPPRPHGSIVNQLQLRFEEMIDFVRPLDGEIDGELGDLLTFIRAKIAARVS